MINRGIPQQPLVRGSPEVVPLSFLLTLIDIRSCPAPMKLSVFDLPTHTLVTEIPFCSRIRNYRSSFRKAVGKRRANPSNTGLALYGGEKLAIKKLDGNMSDGNPTFYRSVIPLA